MINIIALEKNTLFWIVFHGALGALTVFTPWAVIGWFYAVLFLGVFNLMSRNKNRNTLNCLIVYLVSFEILARMAGTSPYIPYELGKYLLFFFLLIGSLSFSGKGTVGIVMLMLLIPGVLLGYIESGLKAIIFNAMGVINISLAILYFKKQQTTIAHFISYIRLLIYPLIAVLAFTLFKSPALDEIEFSLNANFQATGGFGTNQVSTVFGAAVFLLFLFIWYRWKFSPYRWLDIALLLLFTFRGLLSFSRGGMIGGLLAITLVLIIKNNFGQLTPIKKLNLKKILVYTPLLVIALFATFKLADNVTGGLLTLRYSGESAGTLAGTKEKSLTTLTSNRNDIMLEDLAVFTEHAFLGVGVGQSMFHRQNTANQLPHIEMSRLLSEHGLPGLLFFIFLLFQGISIYRSKIPYKNILLAIFILALYTTFHAATRTYFTPLFIGLSLIAIQNIYDENPLPGQQT
ncbi:MAG: O-antigen ligase family protein [Bacteroidales bacterium]|nr:O-antigen ligase family protein [Bacteroidales bacterium]